MKNIMFMIGTLTAGGAERVVSELASELCRQGHKVSVVTVYNGANDYLKDERVRVLQVNHKSKNRIIRIFENIRGIRKSILEIKPDSVISFVWEINVYTLLASMFIKTPVIISERNNPYTDPDSKCLRKLRDNMYKRADGIVFQTTDAQKYFDGINVKNTVISNPIKSELPYWRPNESKRIISAVRLSKQKNIPLLLRAFRNVWEKHKEYKLDIFGKGVLEEELRKMIIDMGLEGNANLMGFSPQIHKEMQDSEMFVISSDFEGISNSMLEALAIGIPTISTDCPIGGARMFIDNDKNGKLVEVGNEKELTEAMLYMIENQEQAEKMSKNSITIREKLSIDTIAKQWIDFVESI